MKLIVLSDLHMDYNRKQPLTDKKEAMIRSLPPVDGVLLCGDNAVPDAHLSNHRRLFSALRSTFSCAIGFIAGNHDLWGGPIPSNDLLQRLKNLAGEGVVYLEHENMSVCGWSIAGTYGHYDYSMGDTSRGVTRENFVKGFVQMGEHTLYWGDKRYMDWLGRSDEEVCHELISDFEDRIRGKQRLVTVSHTVPNPALVGRKPSPEQDFLGAFSGTTELERVIRENPISYHFCGHTHAPASAKIGDATVVNVGTDYNNWRHVVLDTENDSVETICHDL